MRAQAFASGFGLALIVGLTACSGTGHAVNAARGAAAVSATPSDTAAPAVGDTPSAAVSTPYKTPSCLYEPIRRDQVHSARAHIEHLPGVAWVGYLWQRNNLCVVMSHSATASERNRVVQAIAASYNR